ncbi:MAG: hypothetical protein IPM23_15185 [Candidatus Melainabacteria bacterium]|nr:hypothetical protein [Candidatus Melainabacteria bacterium]
MKDPEAAQRKRDELREAEKKEVIQAVAALMIPLSLFLSCVIFAGGAFLIVNHEPFGYFMIGLTAAVAVAAFVALIRFHNGYRAKGYVPGEDGSIELESDEASVDEASEEAAEKSETTEERIPVEK